MSESTVRKLQVPPTDAAALGFALSYDLGQGRTLSVQTFLPNDCSMGELNDMLDKLAIAGERQKARNDISVCETNIESIERTLKNLDEDLGRVEHQYAGEKLLDEEKLKLFAEKKDGLTHQAEQSWIVDGKRGAFKPSNQLHGSLKAIDADIINFKEGMVKREADRQQALKDMAVARTRHQEEIDRQGRLIGKARAKIDGKD